MESEHVFATLPRVSGALLSHAVHGQGSVLAAERVLPVPDSLAPLLPGGLQRGTLVGVSGPGGVTLALSLLIEPLAQGSWAAVVGLPDLGLEAAAALGMELSRVALIPDPGPNWTAVVAVLLDALDMVMVRPPRYCRPADARRLGARARERGSVLLLSAGEAEWPERPDLQLTVETDGWEGLGRGVGTLRRRAARVVVSGRRGADRSRAMTCWLPGPEGRVVARQPEAIPARVADEMPERVAWAG